MNIYDLEMGALKESQSWRAQAFRGTFSYKNGTLKKMYLLKVYKQPLKILFGKV